MAQSGTFIEWLEVGSKVAQEDIIPTDEHVAALEKVKLEKQAMV